MVTTELPGEKATRWAQVRFVFETLDVMTPGYAVQEGKVIRPHERPFEGILELQRIAETLLLLDVTLKAADALYETAIEVVMGREPKDSPTLSLVYVNNALHRLTRKIDPVYYRVAHVGTGSLVVTILVSGSALIGFGTAFLKLLERWDLRLYKREWFRNRLKQEAIATRKSELELQLFEEAVERAKGSDDDPDNMSTLRQRLHNALNPEGCRILPLKDITINEEPE